MVSSLLPQPDQTTPPAAIATTANKERMGRGFLLIGCSRSLFNVAAVNQTEPDNFEGLVADAIDALPGEFQRLLERVAVVVSDLGSERRAYGEYFGDGVAAERYEDRIVIYRDTLERDFGHDRDLLARQVEQTLRHELAHHLGWDEGGVGGLGL